MSSPLPLQRTEKRHATHQRAALSQVWPQQGRLSHRSSVCRKHRFLASSLSSPQSGSAFHGHQGPLITILTCLSQQVQTQMQTQMQQQTLVQTQRSRSEQ
jgi:hypothetical protein